MVNIFEIRNIIIEAKKKYDKKKYIKVLEEQIEKLEIEIERMNTENLILRKEKFMLNSDHLELFKLFRKNNYQYNEDDIKIYAKKSIDLEIALSELIEQGYIEYQSNTPFGIDTYLSIPESKKKIFLKVLKNTMNN